MIFTVPGFSGLIPRRAFGGPFCSSGLAFNILYIYVKYFLDMFPKLPKIGLDQLIRLISDIFAKFYAEKYHKKTLNTHLGPFSNPIFEVP